MESALPWRDVRPRGRRRPRSHRGFLRPHLDRRISGLPRLQHQLAVELSSIVPTLIFGDPMQGIFEFAGATLSWGDEIHPSFPFAGTLETPHRWAGKNPELGQWIAETRLKLIRGVEIGSASGRDRVCQYV